MDVWTIATLALVAAGAGFVDAIAGGGGLITLPALLLAGVPPAQAIATNKLQGTFGVAAATLAYHRAGAIAWETMMLPIVGTAAGAALGAWAVSRMDADFLGPVMPYALLSAALYFALAPLLFKGTKKRVLAPLAFAASLAAPLGFYDGFFGPGAGSLYTLAFSAFAGAVILQAAAHAKVLNLTSNAVAVAVFLLTGQMNFAIGMPMAAGQMLGAWAGSRAAVRHGGRVIRPLLVLTTTAVAIKLWLQ